MYILFRCVKHADSEIENRAVKPAASVTEGQAVEPEVN